MKRVISLLLMLAFLCGAARAELAPAYAQLEEQYDSGRVVTWQVEAQPVKLPDVSDPAFEAIARLMDKLSLRLYMQQGDMPADGLTLTCGGEEVLSFTTQQMTQGVLCTVGDAQYLTPHGEADAIRALLGGTELTLPRLEAGRQALWAQLDGLYALLADAGKQGELVRKTTSVQNVGASGRYIPYDLTMDEMNAVWPDVQLHLQAVLSALLPDGGDEAAALLRTLVFTGDTQVRRIRDKEENDWGFRLTTLAQPAGGAERKITLTVAWRSEKGFCVELKAPCTQGEDTLKVLLTGALTLTDRENKVKLTGEWTVKTDGQSTKHTLEGTLRCTLGEDHDRLHGKLTCKGDGYSYTLSPDLALSRDGLSGQVSLGGNQGGGDFEWLFSVNAAVGEEIIWPEMSENALSLADMEIWEKQFVLQGVEQQWFKALLHLWMKWPADERALITHVLRSGEWMTGESVPVPETEMLWRVKEEMAP